MRPGSMGNPTGGQVSWLAYIRDEGVIAEVVNLMAYGAIIKYEMGGIEYTEMICNEDFDLVEVVDE